MLEDCLRAGAILSVECEAAFRAERIAAPYDWLQAGYGASRAKLSEAETCGTTREDLNKSSALH